MSDKIKTGAFYNKYIDDVTRNRDAVAGERAIKNKSTKYLPPLASMLAYEQELENGDYETKIGATMTAEGRVSYAKYLSLAYFYGASGRTVDGLVGLIYTKPAEKEIPSNIEYMIANADGKGESLRKFSEKLAVDSFVTPRQGILVDHPTTQGAMSVAQAEALNIRPKLLQYKFEDIYEVFYSVINNELKITMVLLREKIAKRKGMEVIEIIQYRLLEIDEDGFYKQVVFDSEGEIIDEIEPKMNGQRISEIPFYLIEVGSEHKAIINDLVDANLNHYRFFADYAHKEHSSAFPIFWETGAIDGCVNNYTGPNVKWENRDPSAKFGILQSASDGGSMRQYLLDMEARMAALGAEMLKPRIAGAESAEAKSLDQVAQNSTVGSVALNVSETLTKALIFANEWAGGSGEVMYKLNQDYNPKGLSGQDLTALFSTYQGGGMSFETFWQNLQKGEIASTSTSAEEEQQKILEEEINLSGGGA